MYHIVGNTNCARLVLVLVPKVVILRTGNMLLKIINQSENQSSDVVREADTLLSWDHPSDIRLAYLSFQMSNRLETLCTWHVGAICQVHNISS